MELESAIDHGVLDPYALDGARAGLKQKLWRKGPMYRL
jgi:hypothetical protein